MILVKVITVNNGLSATTGTSIIRGSHFKILLVMVIMIRRCCVLISAMLLLPLLKMLVITILFMTLASLMQFICWKILYLMIVGRYKLHIKEINFSYRLQLLFWLFNQSKGIRNKKNIGINEKSYKHLKIYFTRYDRGKSIRMASLYYHKLRGKIQKHKEKKIDGWWLYTR